VMPGTDGEAAAEEGGDGAAAEGGSGGGGAGRSLSGAVNSRADAVRAIDMVCQYLERAEPSNPAPLYLRRAQQLINHNFLQLMKELAPNVMSDMAQMFGIDPDTVELPERP
jgi:type VI secretion system protein ImpA